MFCKYSTGSAICLFVRSPVCFAVQILAIMLGDAGGDPFTACRIQIRTVEAESESR